MATLVTLVTNRGERGYPCQQFYWILAFFFAVPRSAGDRVPGLMRQCRCGRAGVVTSTQSEVGVMKADP